MKQKVTNTWVFRFSVISSLLLFASIAYGQKLFRDYWLLHAFVQLLVILFFSVITSWCIVFWAKKDDAFKTPYLPFLINLMMVALIIILPLNWIRNKIEFASNKEQFELAVDIIAHENQEINDQPQIHKLAPELEHLSLDGVVLTMHRPTSKGFFFFTFRGAPEGVAGFLKITGNGKLDNYISDITPDSVVVKTLKDNWYYISTE